MNSSYKRDRDRERPDAVTQAESLVMRARAEYREMPGLRLTLTQACRLWQLDEATCKALLEHLVGDGFLAATATGFYIASPSTYGRL